MEYVSILERRNWGRGFAVLLKLAEETCDEIHSQTPRPTDHYLHCHFKKRQSLKLYINEYLVEVWGFFF